MKLKIACEGSGTASLDELRPLQGKLKELLDENYLKLESEMIRLGFSAPFFVWSKQKGVKRDSLDIIDGHQRLKVLLKMAEEGHELPEEFPIVEIDADNIRQAKEKVLAISSNYGTMQKDGLEKFIADIDMELDEVGERFTFDALDIEEILADDDDEKDEDHSGLDEAPEKKEKAQTETGDLWILGNHRLLCGDATNEKDYERLLDGNKVQLVITDPPYNVDYQGKRTERDRIKNDSMADEDFEKFLLDFYKNAHISLDLGCPIYVFHADISGHLFRQKLLDVGLKLAQCLIWAKESFVVGRQDYHWQHEPILYGWKPGAAHRWYSDRKQATLLKYTRPKNSKQHPTMKPINLLSYLLKNSAQKGDSVLDPFSGSGSTIIAAEKANMAAYGLEIDPCYCDVILQRWCDATGGTAKTVDGKVFNSKK